MPSTNFWKHIISWFARPSSAAKSPQLDAQSNQVPPRTPDLNDHPKSFGYKTMWIAVSTSNGPALSTALGLTNVKLCSWSLGIQTAYNFQGVFITPPIHGWTFAVGNLPEANQETFLPLLQKLSAQFGKVYYFGTHRIVEYQAWAIAEQGHVTRAFCFIGERGEFPLDIGQPTQDESQLAIGTPDLEKPPDEEHVLTLAARWTYDPREIETLTNAHGPGWLGRP